MIYPITKGTCCGLVVQSLWLWVKKNRVFVEVLLQLPHNPVGGSAGFPIALQ